MHVDIIGTCDCLQVNPASLTIAPLASGMVTLGYDPSDDAGKVEKLFIIRTDNPEYKELKLPVVGFVPAATKKNGLQSPELKKKRVLN